MNRQGEEKRLTTILSADIVGYSRLMGLDETGALAALKKHRKELIEAKTSRCRGSIACSYEFRSRSVFQAKLVQSHILGSNSTELCPTLIKPDGLSGKC